MDQNKTPASQATLLTNDEAAAYISVSPNTLPIWRSTHRYDLPFVKVGRLIRYRRSDLDRWLEQQTRQNGDASR